MSPCWLLVLCCVSSVITKSTAQSLQPYLTEPEDDVEDSPPDAYNEFRRLLVHRYRRAIHNDRPSNIFWVHPLLYRGSSKILGKELSHGNKDMGSSQIFNIKPTSRRVKRAFPSTDAVADTDVAQWLKKTPPKSDFITQREHRTGRLPDGDAKENEVEPSFRARNSNQPITNRDFGIEPRADRPFEPPRRIIYYANLPEVTSRDRSISYDPYQRRYEPLPPGVKYPRDSSVDERARLNPIPVDRYRYRPAGQTLSYTIVDAERAPNDYYSPYQSVYPGYPGYQNNKYNKIPAPYRQGDYQVRAREPLGSLGATMVRSEPYRDYNPRQPAPWSVQIGTKLTVKDDERPFRPDTGHRRFYVNSQEPPRYNRVDRSRYNYPF